VSNMAERDDVTTGVAEAQSTVPGSAAQALARHEAEKMSRRAVLAKVGLRFGAAVIAAISVDDLTRAVTASIARSNKDSVVAQQVANEFKNAGVAFATTVPDGSAANCTPTVVGAYCGHIHPNDPNACETCCKGVWSDAGNCPGQGDFIGVSSCKNKCQDCIAYGNYC